MSNSLVGFHRDLERVLGRQLAPHDFARAADRLDRVFGGGASLEDEINIELSHLGGGPAPPPGQLADTLRNYYGIFLQELAFIAEVRSPEPDLSDEDEDEDEDNDDDIVYDENYDASVELRILGLCKTRRYDGKDEDEEADDCCICLDRLRRGLVAALDCKHEFHGECIKTWLVRGRNFCPLCKARALK